MAPGSHISVNAIEATMSVYTSIALIHDAIEYTENYPNNFAKTDHRYSGHLRNAKVWIKVCNANFDYDRRSLLNLHF
jgi:hypothetical protein